MQAGRTRGEAAPALPVNAPVHLPEKWKWKYDCSPQLKLKREKEKCI